MKIMYKNENKIAILHKNYIYCYMIRHYETHGNVYT